MQQSMTSCNIHTVCDYEHKLIVINEHTCTNTHKYSNENV